MAELGDGKRLDHMVAVGRTTPTSVRIWLRAKNPGVHRLRIRRATTGKEVAVVDFTVPAAPDLDLTHAVTYPDDFADAVLLDPLTVYRFDVARVAGRAKVGEGRFETGPSTPADTPDRFSIAVMSCHQPFASDGELDPEHMRVFEVLETILNRNEAKLAILGGDQMYSDAPKRCSVLYPHYLRQAWGKDSILAYSADEVRAIYQDRYRAFWALPELQALYASHTTYPILDDHEIIDDWGADPAHADPSHVSLLAGAREAYFDYQGSRVQPRAAALPPSFHYDFDYGSVGIFVMDVRSERWVVPGQNQLYGGTQLQDLQRFLQRSDDKRLLLLVTSVPIVHIPEWLADAGYDMVGSKVDFGDHWSLKDNVPARDRLLALLLAHQASHPQQRIVLVGGDVHIACALEITFPGLPPMYQFTSSAISNRLSPFEGWAGSQGPRRVPELRAQGPSGVQRAAVSPVHRLKGENPFGGPNVGIIEIDAAADPLRLRFQLWSYDKKGTKRLLAVQKFVSQWVGSR